MFLAGIDVTGLVPVGSRLRGTHLVLNRVSTGTGPAAIRPRSKTIYAVQYPESGALQLIGLVMDYAHVRAQKMKVYDG